jgi:iron complex outermembrane receptor protein
MFDASYSASTFKDIDNTDYLEQPSYWLANGRVAVGSEGGDWNVALYVRNMFDEEYIRQAFDNFGEAWVYETWGAPRTYGITAIKYF